MFKARFLSLFLLLLSLHYFNESYSQDVLAFPGAEGFGKYTSGGRGGEVFVVTNLNDSGPGSLREAVEANGPRSVVFSVSGVIELESPLVIENDNITIAGQSAPNGGITITHYPTLIEANNVIIRYLRFRLGSQNVVDDAFGGIRQSDIIIDHCSFSWGTDETMSLYDNHRTTVQWCIVSESIRAELTHLSHKAPGYAAIWGGKKASFIYNLIAHNHARTPRFNGKRYASGPDEESVEFRNNVIYNWGANPIYGGEDGHYKIINNYYKPGPATPERVRTRLVNPYPPYGKFYVEGNFNTVSANLSRDNWSGQRVWSEGVALEEEKSRVRSIDPIFGLLDAPISAQSAYVKVLDNAGASLYRDDIDKRIIVETREGTAHYGPDGKGIIDSEMNLIQFMHHGSSEVVVDSDKDGIPDWWEEKNGLDANDNSDSKKIKPGSSYTYLEEYLNELVSPPSKPWYNFFLRLLGG